MKTSKIKFIVNHNNNEVLVVDEPSYNRHWIYKPYNKKIIKK